LITAAYISSTNDVFSDMFPSARELGLSSAQVALGEPTGFPVAGDTALSPACGDVHTAVRWYLEWIANCKDLPDTLKGLFRMACFKKMATSLPSVSPEKAVEMLAIPP
jgi:hypothetical protein